MTSSLACSEVINSSFIPHALKGQKLLAQGVLLLELLGLSARTSGQLKSLNHNLNHLSYIIIEVLPCINLVSRV